MSDRLTEIRARLDAATQELVRCLLFGQMEQAAAQDFISSAPDDIAWLLGEVERKTNYAKSLETELRWLRAEHRALGGQT